MAGHCVLVIFVWIGRFWLGVHGLGGAGSGEARAGMSRRGHSPQEAERVPKNAQTLKAFDLLKIARACYASKKTQKPFYFQTDTKTSFG